MNETRETNTTVEAPPRGQMSRRRRRRRRAVACALALVLGVLASWRFVRHPAEEEPAAIASGAIEVPLGVEEAAVIRYSGPRLVARPYKRGASLNVRIAQEAERNGVRTYDVRYVVNLPGDFELTDYLTSADGRAMDDLPRFRIRGLTRLTKDIETRIREIEDVEIRIWRWYRETLVGVGVLWGLWLVGLLFIGRPKRPPRPVPLPSPPTVEERILASLRRLAEHELTVEEKAELELLLLTHWTTRLGAAERLADACRRLESDARFGRAYAALERWLHAPSGGVNAAEILELCRPSAPGEGEVAP